MVDTRSSTHAGNAHAHSGDARTPTQRTPPPVPGPSAFSPPTVRSENLATSAPARPPESGVSPASIFLEAEDTPAARGHAREHASHHGLVTPNAPPWGLFPRIFGTVSEALRGMLLVTPAHQVTLAAAPTTRNDSNEHIDPFGDPTAVAYRPPSELPRTPPELSPLHDIPCVLFFDGACRNRKGGGPGGSGAVIYRLDTEEEVCRASRPLELTTSNRAEYDALSLGLQLALDNGVNRLLDICGDSQLIIGQLDGSKQINSHEMKACHHTASGLLSEFTTPPRLHWIPRERNTVADALATTAKTTRTATNTTGAPRHGQHINPLFRPGQPVPPRTQSHLTAGQHTTRHSPVVTIARGSTPATITGPGATPGVSPPHVPTPPNPRVRTAVIVRNSNGHTNPPVSTINFTERVVCRAAPRDAAKLSADILAVTAANAARADEAADTPAADAAAQAADAVADATAQPPRPTASKRLRRTAARPMVLRDTALSESFLRISMISASVGMGSPGKLRRSGCMPGIVISAPS